ncbi:RhoGAP-domain-containing protein [Coniophora puteana RWD-64-598 SS2]|uniref:RhoGAP-domain-containing protein n=1 Tax=Coniophora puteana (strain RWD-64-598) TaxID=741705 RepID=A0A5M3MIH8_CONPW|nr:RhoGAP-domain-containing protein [Coniophora puteana RWD-64-598 SS2]EIW79048.1 RhoGAP-domain-containing protein [Coniophora puteana RWD-64-598 SS2]
MTEEAHTTPAWDSHPPDNADSQSPPQPHVRALSPTSPTVQLVESSSTPAALSPPHRAYSPPPRSSSDSIGRLSDSRWPGLDSLPTLERKDTFTSSIPNGDLVEPSFDENALRALCELDCGVPLLLDRIKQSMVSCREVSVFFKKRAVLEEEYGKSLQKLSRTTSEVYAMNDGKAGSFVNAWQTSMKTHEVMAENRIRFAHRLNEMSEELAQLAKEVDKNRKQTKELATRYERALQDSEMIMEKSKARLDMNSEELERVLLQKEGESYKDNAVQTKPPSGAPGKRVLGKAVAKGGLLLKGKNPGNILRQEDDIRLRVSNASDTYRKALIDTQTMRQEYFNFQLPRILRSLKECTDEIDLGTQYHLTRYAFLFESIVLSDGSTLVPPPTEEGLPSGAGLKSTLESIDNRADFKLYMQNYAYARGSAPLRGPRRDGPAEEGFVRPLYPFTRLVSPQSGGLHMPDRGRPTFGVDLAEQMARDNADVPSILEKCCATIERHGLRSQGIYRLSGMARKVNTLKERLDKDMDNVNLDAEEWISDINTVTSVLKMWLRELPEPLMTSQLHQGFVDAAKIENDRLRHIRLHERVNDLPDPNYATLKFFMGHLHKIVQYEAENSMSIQNIGIVFGPTLFGQQVPTANGAASGHANGMADTPHQNKAIETILEHYTDIFVDEGEAS